MRKNLNQDAFHPIVRGVAQAGVRVANERAVMTLIAGNPGCSNADIARITGLGPQTTARILADLEERDLVRRGALLRGRRGQPATPYRLNPEGAYSLGVEIGWRHAEVLLFSMAGQVLARRRHAYPFPEVETLFARLAADIETVLSGLAPAQRERITGLGLAMPGTFGEALARLGASPAQIAAWAGFDPVARLAGMTGHFVHRVNDGNAAAWGEIAFHATPRPSGFAYLHIGTFIGAGLVIEGNLWDGPGGNAADLGATIAVSRDGQPTFPHLAASLFALGECLERAGLRPAEPDPARWDWRTLEPVLGGWIEDAGHVLAQAAMTARALAEVDVVVIGGELPQAVLGRLMQAMRASLHALPPLGHGLPEIKPGQLGASAGAIGAAQLVFFRSFFSRVWDVFEAPLA